MSVVDPFTDANGTNLTSHTAVITWGKQTAGQPQIQSNALQPKAAGADQLCYDNTNSYNNDQSAQAKLVVNTDTTDKVIGCAVRVSTSAETAYFWYISQQAAHHFLEMWKIVGGATTQLGSTGADLVVNDVILIDATGTSITAKVNGTTSIGPITDSAIASGKAGVFGFDSSTGTAIDDWTATGNISGGGAPVAKPLIISQAINRAATY